MIVRAFAHPDGVQILIPTYPEALDRDTKRFFQGIAYIDLDSSDFPTRQLSNGTCQRCHWKVDIINNKVIVNKTFDCEHDILKRIKDKINNIDKNIALEGLLELERFRLNRGK